MEGLTCDCGPQCGGVLGVLMNGSSFVAVANGSLSADGNSTDESGADSTGKLLENLIPALMKTFLVILTGFIMGSTGVYVGEELIGEHANNIHTNIRTYTHQCTCHTTHS